MRALRSRALAALAIIAGFTAIPAAAAEVGFYVGFLYGDSSKEFDREQVSSVASILYERLQHVSDLRTFSTKTDGESYGFMAGYRLTQNIAFEGGYMYLGKETYREASSGTFFPIDGDPVAENLNLSLTTRTSGFALSALGILPISYSWEVYARAGVLIGSNTLSVYAFNPGQPGAWESRENESSTDWLAGAGISMSLAEVYALRAEFTRVFDAGADVFGEADADVVSIGITVSF